LRFDRLDQQRLRLRVFRRNLVEYNLMSIILGAATSRDVESWSYGAVVNRRPGALSNWSARKGSLLDEAIFGPTVDYQCSCGKYSGKATAAGICETCGVKITSRQARWKRFGHINLLVPVRYEVFDLVNEIESFPVLPAAIRGSNGGAGVDDLYEAMIDANITNQRASVEHVCQEICALISPVVLTMIEWNLEDAQLLAKGIGIIIAQTSE
jgi:hypothetical protein